MYLKLELTNGSKILLPVFQTVFWEGKQKNESKVVYAKVNDEVFILSTTINEIEKLCSNLKF